MKGKKLNDNADYELGCSWSIDLVHCLEGPFYNAIDLDYELDYRKKCRKFD